MSISGGAHLLSSNHPHVITVKKTTLPPFFSSDLLLKKRCLLYIQPLAQLPLSVTCKASSSSNDRRNPNIPKNNYQGPPPSRGKFKNYQDREDLLETNKILSTKNGRSTTPNPSAATKPVNKDEILELFRKYLPQMQEGAENRPVNNNRSYGAQTPLQKRGKEAREDFDSLLKLLKKCGADQKRTTNSNRISGTVNNIRKSLEYEVADGAESDSENVKGGSDFEDDVPDELDSQPVPVTSSRPASSFSRRSPVPEVMYELIVPSQAQGGKTRESREEQKSESESESLFCESESEFGVEQSEGLISEEKNVELGALKLSELRGIAKSRGMKGYSKLKKAELVEKLSLS